MKRLKGSFEVELVKAGVGAFIGVGTGVLVGEAVAKLTPADLNWGNRLAVKVAGAAVGVYAADKIGDHVGKYIDGVAETIDTFNETIAEVK